MDYSCPCCGKSLEGKGGLMVAELRNGYKQVTCIYCSKLIQIKSTVSHHKTMGMFFAIPVGALFSLMLSDREFAWYWWAGNAALALFCCLGGWKMHLEHKKNAKFYEEPRFNRPIPKQRKIEK
jgi:DNA-directed RNA polymerase subunit RPC12/RpoP